MVREPGPGERRFGTVDGSTPRKRQGPDPLGKRALFWAPGSEAGDVRRTAGSPLGRRALFSDAHGTEAAVAGDLVARRGPITVECGRCKVISKVGLVDFALFQLPIGFWLPRGKYSHLMTCPACRRRVWASVTLRR